MDNLQKCCTGPRKDNPLPFSFLCKGTELKSVSKITDFQHPADNHSTVQALITKTLDWTNIHMLSLHYNRTLWLPVKWMTFKLMEQTHWAGILSCWRTKGQIPTKRAAAEPRLHQQQSLQCLCHLDETWWKSQTHLIWKWDRSTDPLF